MIYGTWLTLRHLNTPPPHLDAPYALYPISILKPLKGADEGLRENLESFFHLDYPEYELLFSVADSRDPARFIVESLLVKHAGKKVKARLLIGQEDLGPNPKVNNLARSYREAAHDWLLISDSNIRVERDYLKRLFGNVETGVGLVTSVVAGHRPDGLGGLLESTYLNTFYARGMVLAARFGRPCVIGKSMLFQRSTAERFGGLKELARYLAEDYMAGEAMQKLGLRVVIAPDPVSQHLGTYSFDDFWARHVRWGRIRKSQAPIAFLGEILMNAFVSGIAGAFALEALFGWSAFAVFTIHILTWALADQLLMIQLRAPRDILITPFVWLGREALAVPLWVATALGNTVLWRGKRLKLAPGGLLA